MLFRCFLVKHCVVLEALMFPRTWNFFPSNVVFSVYLIINWYWSMLHWCNSTCKRSSYLNVTFF
jgi:hypothetical protein